MGGKGSYQDDDKREMEEQDPETLVKSALEHIVHARYAEHSPQQYEPPCSIDMLADVWGALEFLYYRS